MAMVALSIVVFERSIPFASLHLLCISMKYMVHAQMLSTVDQRPSPVDHTQHPACLQRNMLKLC